MTTVTRSRQRAAAPSTTALPVLLKQLEAELCTIFFEREMHIDVILTSWLARVHGYAEGDPGTGKSDLLETISKAIVGSRYARFQMDPYMGKEDLYGLQDIADFMAGKGWYRNTEGTAVDSHFILWDELPRTNGGVLASMLSLQNERFFKDGNRRIDAPLISAWGAANDPLFDVLPALADRFMFYLDFGDLKEESSFQKLYARKCDGVSTALQTQIPLAMLQHAIEVEVPAVVIPAGVQESVRQLRSDLAAEQVRLSIRRWMNTERIIKGAAYKAGKTVADEDDLAVLQHVLYQHADHKAIVRSKVLALTSPITKAALELGAQIDAFSAEIDKRKRKSLQERAAYGADVTHNLNQIQTKLSKQVEAAHREGRNPSVLDEVAAQIKALRLKVHTDCMNFPASTFPGR